MVRKKDAPVMTRMHGKGCRSEHCTINVCESVVVEASIRKRHSARQRAARSKYSVIEGDNRVEGRCVSLELAYSLTSFHHNLYRSLMTRHTLQQDILVTDLSIFQRLPASDCRSIRLNQAPPSGRLFVLPSFNNAMKSRSPLRKAKVNPASLLYIVQVELSMAHAAPQLLRRLLVLAVRHVQAVLPGNADNLAWLLPDYEQDFDGRYITTSLYLLGSTQQTKKLLIRNWPFTSSARPRQNAFLHQSRCALTTNDVKQEYTALHVCNAVSITRLPFVQPSAQPVRCLHSLAQLHSSIACIASWTAMWRCDSATSA